MAFESYLEHATVRPRRGRRLMYIGSAALHAAAVLCAVAYSFWHVEELTPPTVTVTFVSAAAIPPPPPPPPPLGGGTAAPKHKTVTHTKIDLAPKVTEIVQPKVEVKETPQETPPAPVKEVVKKDNDDNPGGPGTANGVKGGVPGGVKGGVVGGIVGGTGRTPIQTVSTAKFLAPQMGAQQKLSGDDPDFPTFLRRSGSNYLVMAKICVGISGQVEGVTLLKRAEPTLDNNVASRVKTWRFRPLMANGTPAPFCYFGRFEFKSE